MPAEPIPVSVVIPAYNRPAMAERALASVFAQTLAADEVLVVDDGSHGDTAERAEAAGATVVRHDRNRGKSAARNSGLTAARHDHVALLDCDDRWLPTHLETLWPERDEHVLVGSAMLGDEDPPRLYGWSGGGRALISNPADASLPENRLQPSTMLIRRDLALEVGGFPSVDFAEDLHLWLRMLERGTGLILPVVTAIYHRHGEQASADRPRMWDARGDVMREFADRPWCTRAVLARHEAVTAWDAARARTAGGEGRGRVLRELAPMLTSPARMAGLASLLRYRANVRRASREWARRLPA